MTLPVPSIDPGANARVNRARAKARKAAEAEPLPPMNLTGTPRPPRVRREPRPDFPHLRRDAYGPPSRRLVAQEADVYALDDYRTDDVNPQQLHDAV